MSKARDIADLFGDSNAANGFVRLDASGNLPAVDGSALTGIAASGGGGLADFTSQTPVVGEVISNGLDYYNDTANPQAYSYSGTGFHSVLLGAPFNSTFTGDTAPTKTINSNGVFWVMWYSASAYETNEAVYDRYRTSESYSSLATDGTVTIRVRKADGTSILKGTLVGKPTKQITYNAGVYGTFYTNYIGFEIGTVTSGSIDAVEDNSANANGLNFIDVITSGGTIPVLEAGERYLVSDLASGEVKLPTSPSVGDEVTIVDANQNFGTNALTVLRNGSKILGEADDLSVDADGSAFTLIYTGSTEGWVYATK